MAQKISPRHLGILLAFSLLFHPAARASSTSSVQQASRVAGGGVEGPAWMTNLDSAEALAQKEHKKILLNFSGSDWCIPCISLRREIFDNSAFQQFAADNIILVNADFPRKKKNQLSAEQQKINDALAEKYNPEGHFPYTLLLDSDGSLIKVWEGFYNKGPENFIQEIRQAGGLE